MEVIIKQTYEEMSRAAAQDVARLLNTKPNAVLGMATGSTPLGLYQELVRMHRDEGLDFSQVTTFNLDEYVGLRPSHPQSYHYFMHENFFKHVNVPKQNIYIPSGNTSNYPAFCALVRAADSGMRRDRPADSGDWLRRPRRVQRAGQFADLAHASQDAGQADDRRQRAVLRQAGGRAHLRDHDGRRHDSRSAPAVAVRQRQEQGLGGRGGDRGPGDGHGHGQRLQMHPHAKVFLDNDAAGELKMREYYDWIEERRPGAPRYS